jgi:hypothetical protein
MVNQSLAESQAGRHRRVALSQERCSIESGCRSLPSSWGPLPRSGTRAKGPGTKGARIGDAAKHAIRRAKGNGDFGPRRAALGSWRLLG